MEEARILAWFVKGLHHEAIRLARKHNRIQEHELLILNQWVRQDLVGEVITEVVDTVLAVSDTLSEVEDKLFLQEALLLLTPQQQKVIRATILEGSTEQEVASEMRVSKQAVNRLKGRALNKLKKHFVLDEPTCK